MVKNDVFTSSLVQQLNFAPNYSNCEFPPSPKLPMSVLPVFSAAPVQPPFNSYQPLRADEIRFIRIEIPPTVLLLRLLQASRTAHRNNLQPVIFDLNPNKLLPDAVFYSDSLISN
jgi:hypothetical protein